MIRNSGTGTRNPAIVDWSERYEGGDNGEFWSAALAELTADGRGHGGYMMLGFLGSRDLPGVTLRQAQAALRWDLRPSLWSHVFLVAEQLGANGGGANGGGAVDSLTLREVTLQSRTGKFPDPAYNAVLDGRLGLYRDPLIDANAALVAIDMTAADVRAVGGRATYDLNLDRLRYNLWETLGVWEGYLWSTGARSNPLAEGFPVFSSAFVEYCFEAIHLDLSPGASERNSAPEHIWNAVVWWHEAFSALNHAVRGFFVVRDPGCSQLGADASDVAPGPYREPVLAKGDDEGAPAGSGA